MGARGKSADVIGVVEAAYDLTSVKNEGRWLVDVLERFQPILDQGLGTCAFVVERGKPIRGVAGLDIVDGWLESLAAMMPVSDPSNELLYPSRAALTASDAMGSDFADMPGIRSHWHPRGVKDGIGVTASDGSESHVTFVAPLAEITSLNAKTIALYERIAGHVAAGWRLRSVIARAEREAAVLDPSGKVLHAEGHARDAGPRESLRQAAKDIDRARSSLRSKSSDEALDLWRVLVSGEWSLVDRFDSDGRRYLVAHENQPSLKDPRGLSPRELQVLTLTGLGHSAKLIAYELGLTISTISATRSRAMRKLGLRSLAEIAQLFPPGK